jgi:hypothetical protein
MNLRKGILIINAPLTTEGEGHTVRQKHRRRARMTPQPQPDHILQVGLGFWASKTLLSAAEMDVFTELANHPADLETLQGRLGLHQRSARDFLDALVALKFLERPQWPVLQHAQPGFEMATRRLYPFWNHLTTALRSGLPQNEIRDGNSNPFAAIYAEPTRLKEFLKAMSGVSHCANVAIAHQFPWNKYRTAVETRIEHLVGPDSMVIGTK